MIMCEESKGREKGFFSCKTLSFSLLKRREKRRGFFLTYYYYIYAACALTYYCDHSNRTQYLCKGLDIC